MVFLQQLACVCSLLAACTDSPGLDAASDAINVLADLTYCSVCACLQTQHRVELDVRDGRRAPLNPDGAAARRAAETAPPVVQAMAKEGRPAPHAGPAAVGGVPEHPWTSRAAPRG